MSPEKMDGEDEWLCRTVTQLFKVVVLIWSVTRPKDERGLPKTFKLKFKNILIVN